jgi:FkbM family methyltransferase
MNNDLENFDWGTSNQWYRETIKSEIFVDKIYEKIFEVEEGDIVLDVGASIGPFAYSIVHKNPSHVFCLEPSGDEFMTLVNNTRKYPVTCINKGIGERNGEMVFDALFGPENKPGKAMGITFQQFIKDYRFERIDFIKTDCEGGEYDIFNPENLIWIKTRVRKITGEWHLSTPELKEKFRIFRDVYLRVFDNFEVYSVDGIDIKWDLWNEHFIEHYNEIIIYINNDNLQGTFRG